MDIKSHIYQGRTPHVCFTFSLPYVSLFFLEINLVLIIFQNNIVDMQRDTNKSFTLKRKKLKKRRHKQKLHIEKKEV